MLPSKVAIRTLALEREELISQGRKVVCPDNRLICDAIPLMFARALVEDLFFFFFFGQKSSELIQEKKGKQLWKSALTKQSLFGHQGEDLFSTILNWKLFLASFKIETFREFAIQKVSVETPVKPCRSVAWGEMWFGYIGQVEVVNGGVVGRDGKLAPARTALSCLANEATHLRVLHGSTWIEVWIWLLLLAFRRCPSPHCWENCVYLGLHVKMP